MIWIQLFLCSALVLTSSCSVIHPAHKPVSPIKHKTDTTPKKNIKPARLTHIHGVTQRQQSFYWCDNCKQLTPKTISPKVQHERPNIHETVYFDFNTSSLTTQAQQKIIHLIKKLHSVRNPLHIYISAYTDSISNKAINDHLARQRANAVLIFLRKRMRNYQHVTYQTSAHGKCCYAKVPTDSGKNRRAVIYVKRSQQ